MIGFITTAHQSLQYRSKGAEYLEKYVTSIKKVQKTLEFSYKIFVMDNESEVPFVTSEDYEVTRFSNQKEGGLSRTWNRGCQLARNANCELLIVSNDDIQFTESLSSLFNFYANNKDKENSFVGPISNGVSTHHQKGDSPRDKVVEYTNSAWASRPGFPLNGFCQAFHSSFYDKFNVSGNLWNVDGTKPRWGGEENDLFDRCTPKGMRSYVCEGWYVHHDKVSGWRKLL
mgnify:CR=1 FL=1